ncbi:MAG: acetate uptake transporter [Deferribacteraceae bacterium]|jgi:succinate-acetate transporter protein|nr:acetate uptake transporter [Deferribacteraceae bacterium]
MSNSPVEVKITGADPSALGIFGLAMVTLVASTQKLGITTGLSFVIPWAIILGGIAQLIACVQDYKLKNLFGATAFGAYGLFWLAVAFSWMIKMGVFGAELAANTDGKQIGVAFIGYLIFSIYMTVAAMNTNKALFLILFLINILFLTLALDSFGFGAIWQRIAGVVELAISLAGFYAAAASSLNNQYGHVILPVGKKIWS